MGWWLGLGLGCGPAVEAPDDGGASTTTVVATTQTDSPSETTASAPDTSTSEGVDSTSTGETDADLCLQWCLNAEARGCDPPFTGETCYTRCLDSIAYGIDRGCEQEQRDVLECEAQVGPPAEIFCESLECEDAYKRDDLCRGWCAHLGGNPGSGGSPDDCDWRSSCYGHEFEAVCPVNDAAGLCSCTIDGQEIAQCEVGVDLSAFECGGEEIHVFKTCCREAFEGVLFP